MKALTLFAGIIAVFGVTCFGQTWNKQSLEKLFADVAKDEKLVAECDKARREYQIKEFGKARLKIAGHCWEGCPVSVPKPYYPTEARRLQISGEVIVDTVVDEKGDVIFAKVVKGNAFLRRSALAAANKSKYQPKVTCGNKPIKFRWAIKYYFSPSM